MKIVLQKNLKTFKSFLAIQGNIGSEAWITFKPEGMGIITSSGGTVGANAEFTPEFFEEYVVTEGEEIGVYLSDLIKPLKNLTVSVAIETKENKLTLTSGKDVFKMPLVEEVSGFKVLPKIQYTFKAGMKYQELGEILDKLKITGSEVVTFSVKDGWLTAQSKSGEREIVSQIRPADPLEGDVKVAIEFMESIIQKGPDNVTIFLGDGKPLTTIYESSGARLTCMVAPRVGENDD